MYEWNENTSTITQYYFLDKTVIIVMKYYFYDFCLDIYCMPYHINTFYTYDLSGMQTKLVDKKLIK